MCVACRKKGGRSGRKAASGVLFKDWCVGVFGVWGVVFFFWLL